MSKGGQLPSQIYAAEHLFPGREIAVIDGQPQDVEPTEFEFADLAFGRVVEEGGELIYGVKALRARAVELGGNRGLSDA